LEPAGKQSHHVELVATVLLAVAAVATAWSTYQSTQWRGDQAVHASRSTAARIESSDASTRAGQLTQIDVAIFTQWVNADLAGNNAQADFYRQRFRDEFQPAFAAWLATNPRTNSAAPKSPFAMPQYQLAESTEANRLDAVATLQSTEGNRAITRSDDYMLAVVLFAISLFFAGISTKLNSERQRQWIVGVGSVIFVVTAIWIATRPISLV
jgi:hypothetical protein